MDFSAILEQLGPLLMKAKGAKDAAGALNATEATKGAIGTLPQDGPFKMAAGNGTSVLGKTEQVGISTPDMANKPGLNFLNSMTPQQQGSFLGNAGMMPKGQSAVEQGEALQGKVMKPILKMGANALLPGVGGMIVEAGDKLIKMKTAGDLKSQASMEARAMEGSGYGSFKDGGFSGGIGDNKTNSKRKPVTGPERTVISDVYAENPAFVTKLMLEDFKNFKSYSARTNPNFPNAGYIQKDGKKIDIDQLTAERMGFKNGGNTVGEDEKKEFNYNNKENSSKIITQIRPKKEYSKEENGESLAAVESIPERTFNYKVPFDEPKLQIPYKYSDLVDNEKSIDENKKFLIDMANSPLYKERYMKMTGSKNKSKLFQKNIIDNLNTVSYVNSSEGNSFLKDENARGAYIKNAGDINHFYNSKEGHVVVFSDITKPESIIHESSHASTKGELKFKTPYDIKKPYFNFLFDKAKNSGYTDIEAKNIVSSSENDIKKHGQKNVSFEDYLKTPTEIKARVDVIRKFMYDRKLYDPIHERFTKKNYEDLILKSSSEDNVPDNIKEIIHKFHKKDVIRMMNEIVENKKQNFNSNLV